jgi:RNA polymerase sigma-70 factor (ECF subfamily)
MTAPIAVPLTDPAPEPAAPVRPRLALVAEGYARRVTDRALEPQPVPQREEPSSRWWLEALRSSGAEREQAVAMLHDLMLRAARFELGRRRAALAHVRGEELDDLAVQAADDAAVAVLAKLDEFRGASRFTTWAYKFALLEAGVRLRRRAWQEREVVLDSDGWAAFASRDGSVHAGLERVELLDRLKRAIDVTLTPHQRRVFIALALNEVPIDVLAERLGTSRGALYKALHDARRKLRRELANEGLAVPGAEPEVTR